MFQNPIEVCDLVVIPRGSSYLDIGVVTKINPKTFVAKCIQYDEYVDWRTWERIEPKWEVERIVRRPHLCLVITKPEFWDVIHRLMEEDNIDN